MIGELVCNHTQMSRARPIFVFSFVYLFLCICISVFVWVGDGMQGWFAITHGSCRARGHTCCSGLTEVPCLMSTSSIPNASDCHLSDAHLLFIYWGCTNCFLSKTALSSKHCTIVKLKNGVKSSQLWQIISPNNFQRKFTQLWEMMYKHPKNKNK